MTRTIGYAARILALVTVAALLVPVAQARPGDDPRELAADRLRQAITPNPPLLTDPTLDPATEPRAQRHAPSQPGDVDIQGSVDQLVIDGAVGASARVDSAAYRGAWASGKRWYHANPPALTTSPFRVASTTKMMIATLVLQQVDAGRWTLDTTVGQIRPGLLGERDEVTLEQLLSHRSGLPDGLGLVISMNLPDGTWPSIISALGVGTTDEDLIDAALAMGWLFEPGTDFSYSNAGYVALGMLLETVTGRSVPDLIKRDIVQRVGMPHTTFAMAPGLRGNALQETLFAEGSAYALDVHPTLFSSAGAVVSTTKDLNAFTDALLDGRLLSPEMLEEMKTPRTMDWYGLGLYRLPDPCGAPEGPVPWLYGHDGAAFGTMSLAFSSEDGERQYSIGVTGRYFTDDPQAPMPYDINDPLLAMIAATC